MNAKKIAVLAALVAAIAVGTYFARDYLTFEAIKEYQGEVERFHEENATVFTLVFFFGYIVVTALSLPGAAVMTLLAGAIFKLVPGTILVSFASSIGATLAFLVSRFLFGKALQERYGEKLGKINEGIEKEGAFYLFTLRLVPAFPFFLINLLMGLTKIRTFTFYWVSQVGMLAGTIVYVNAGTQLASIESPAGILSPGLIGSFVLLGIFPLLAKKAVGLVKRRKAGDGEAAA